MISSFPRLFSDTSRYEKRQQRRSALTQRGDACRWYVILNSNMSLYLRLAAGSTISQMLISPTGNSIYLNSEVSSLSRPCGLLNVSTIKRIDLRQSRNYR